MASPYYPNVRVYLVETSEPKENVIIHRFSQVEAQNAERIENDKSEKKWKHSKRTPNPNININMDEAKTMSNIYFIRSVPPSSFLSIECSIFFFSYSWVLSLFIFFSFFFFPRKKLNRFDFYRSIFIDSSSSSSRVALTGTGTGNIAMFFSSHTSANRLFFSLSSKWLVISKAKEATCVREAWAGSTSNILSISYAPFNQIIIFFKFIFKLVRTHRTTPFAYISNTFTQMDGRARRWAARLAYCLFCGPTPRSSDSFGGQCNVWCIARTIAIQMNILWRAVTVAVVVLFVQFFLYIPNFGFHRDVNIGLFLLSDLSMALCVRF